MSHAFAKMLWPVENMFSLSAIIDCYVGFFHSFHVSLYFNGIARIFTPATIFFFLVALPATIFYSSVVVCFLEVPRSSPLMLLLSVPATNDTAINTLVLLMLLLILLLAIVIDFYANGLTEKDCVTSCSKPP